jgi:tRNA(Ile)-lysidine synthase
LGVIYIDAEKLKEGFRIRKWEQGDWFIPLGMKGKKKLSDFFIDEKFSIRQKENTFVLVSGNEIAAVLGSRVDERFKLDAGTRKVLIIKKK